MARFHIGEVTVLAELGAGAGGRVFHVRRWADSAEYALKVVAAGGRANPRHLEQLRHEFRVGQMFDHPNLMKVHALEVRRNWLFRPTSARLLAEFAPGRSLDRFPPLDTDAALGVFERVAAALEHMHRRGVFHADLKPQNVIYDGAAGIKVVDFGLAWVRGETKARVQGTPEYMAPETAERRLVNVGTDLYNLGATMYHLVTRRTLALPAPGVALAARAHAARVRPVASLSPGAPEALCELIHRCIEYDPARRPARAEDVRSALARLARRRSIEREQH